jgi:hypothetical protein
MQIKITNPDGNPNSTDISDAKTGEPLKYVTDIEIRASRERMEAILTMALVPVDLIAHVEGVILYPDYAEIEVDKTTHRVSLVGETEDKVRVRIQKL